MAYIGYDARMHVAPRRTAPARDQTARRPSPWDRVAWGRLAAITVSLAAWVGIITAVRAIF